MIAFDGLRVLEVSSGIAAAYCGRLFASAGADVVKLEPPSGDPLRRWSASGGPPGALFGFLHGGKRSVTRPLPADLVITDEPGSFEAPVVVTVTPFGPDGPYVGLPVNEFVLQAMCGSIGGRGWPDEVPLQAGGRIGEWVTGCYAAVAAAAAVRAGRSERIDVSAFEAMVLSMGGLSAVLGTGAPRTRELPSIVATADGLVGFCTVTAQQFADFLVLIERPELREDPTLASFAGRARRREEFTAIVEDWACTRTTAEIVELAAALRIPVAPVAGPGTVTGIDHFRERGVFVENAAGALQPRTPYRSAAFASVGPGPVPDVGADEGQVCWGPRPAPGPSDGRPLRGLRVVDLTVFWAGPVATQTLAALGADVIKVEGLRRPDGMRFSGARPPSTDRWWETGGFYLANNSGKRGITLELSRPRARELVLDLIATADLVVENFSPRVLDNLGLDEATIRAANPRAVLVRMPAFGLDGPWRDRVGFAQTMEQASGMAWMTGHADGPPLIPRGPCDPIAGLHAAFAALAGLSVRDRTGDGMVVESTMVEAALNVAAEALLEMSTHGRELRRDGNRGPGAAPQGVYRCAGADEWVALAVLDDRAWAGLATELDLGRRDVPERGPAEIQPLSRTSREQSAGAALAGRPDLADEPGRRRHADELDAVLTAWAVRRTPEEAVERLRAAGVAAARVAAAADLLTDPQLAARGFWQDVEHPVVGRLRTVGMPFRFAGVPGPWFDTPAPLLGEHNAEVLGGVLGSSPAELAELAADQVIGDRPAGL